MVGRFLGERFGRYAVGLAGVVLSGIGLNILIEHLTAAAQ
jgi:putative Mn2+ efflux pump MntP